MDYSRAVWKKRVWGRGRFFAANAEGMKETGVHTGARRGADHLATAPVVRRVAIPCITGSAQKAFKSSASLCHQSRQRYGNGCSPRRAGNSSQYVLNALEQFLRRTRDSHHRIRFLNHSVGAFSESQQ